MKFRHFVFFICLIGVSLALTSCRYRFTEKMLYYSYVFDSVNETYTIEIKSGLNENSPAVEDFSLDSGFISKSVKRLIFPSTYKGFKVTVIDSFVYSGYTMFGNKHNFLKKYTDLEEVILPDTLERFNGNFLIALNLKTNSYLSENYIKSETNDYFYLLSTCKENDKETKAIIHDGCKIIGDYAFYRSLPDYRYNNTMIDTVCLPSSVISIGKYSFFDCSELENIELKEGLLYIGDYAFYRSKIKNINIPDSVIFIGDYAFNNWNKDEKEY